MNVLAVSCHPDDMEVGCGGTLRRYVKEGHTVTVCHVANGNMGHILIGPEELRHIRLEEARRGGEILGVHEVITLDVGDLQVDSNDQGLVRAMVEVIRHVRPDVILTHDENDYMKDHVETGRLVFDASFSCTVPHFETASPVYGAFAPIYYMDTLAGINFVPEQYVDISGTIEDKLQALACHESQVRWMLDHDHIDFLDFVRTCAKYRGLQSNAAYAEGFRTCKVWPRMVTRSLLPQ